jgi:hypothetical protein
VFKTGADIAQLSISGDSLTAIGINHSEPTRAGGEASSQRFKELGSAVAASGLTMFLK